MSGKYSYFDPPQLQCPICAASTVVTYVSVSERPLVFIIEWECAHHHKWIYEGSEADLFDSSLVKQQVTQE